MAATKTNKSQSQSPVSSTEDVNEQSVDEALILSNFGFEYITKITETLQGSIWRGEQKSMSGECIASAIKITNKRLHENAKGFVDGVVYYLDENILVEQAILKYITQQKDCPDGIVKYYDFYESVSDYFVLVMEDGGQSLFDFVLRVHQLIKKGIIDVEHWQKVVKVILRQMIECIDYIHSQNICHYDISLENFLINDVAVEIHQDLDQKEKMVFVLDDICVKLCDFGLAELFGNKQCRSNKNCGKSSYKSPEVLSGNYFSAKKNDIWGLGITLFKMTSGLAPWNVAKPSDEAFAFAILHSITHLLKTWNILYYFDADLLYLLNGIFRNEANRISLKKMKHFVDY